MGKQPCCHKQKLRKGLWSPEEDEKLMGHIANYGHGCWSSIPKLAGLERCGKSCRLRWINYLRPDLKRGAFTVEEENLIVQLHAVLGNRWSQIVAQLPGRTDNEIKNLWNTSLKKKLVRKGIDPNMHKSHSEVYEEGRILDATDRSSNRTSSGDTDAVTTTLNLKMAPTKSDKNQLELGEFIPNMKTSPSVTASYQSPLPSHQLNHFCSTTLLADSSSTGAFWSDSEAELKCKQCFELNQEINFRIAPTTSSLNLPPQREDKYQMQRLSQNLVGMPGDGHWEMCTSGYCCSSRNSNLQNSYMLESNSTNLFTSKNDLHVNPLLPTKNILLLDANRFNLPLHQAHHSFCHLTIPWELLVENMNFSQHLQYCWSTTPEWIFHRATKTQIQ